MSHRLGAFVIERPLASGGMSRVWAGRHAEQGLPVAIKVLTAERARSPAARAALLAEARAVARIDHPGVVRLLDIGVVEATGGIMPIAPGSPYLVMERAEGTLADELPMPSVDAIEALRAVLAALAAAHARGVVHRDVKPGNVLRLGGRLVLADFGVADRLAEAGATGAGAGTPSFMAPEQLDADRAAQGPWTDLYAVGCLAHMLLTGRPPFVGPDVIAVADAHRYAPPPPLTGVTSAFAGWVDRLLAKDPARRYATAADALAALDGLDRPPWRGDWRVAYEAPPFDVIGAGLALYRHRPVPMVGRAEARDAIWAALGEVVETGDARVALIAGEPGVGKSRLAQWVVERAVEWGLARAVVTRGAERPGLSAARALGVPAGADAATTRRVLDRALAAAAPSVDERVELTRLLVGRVGGEGAARTRAALIVNLLGLWAFERPVIWWIDDAEAAPAAIDAVTAALALDEGAGLPVLFVVCATEQDATPGETATDETRGAAQDDLMALIGRPATRPIALEPLTPLATRALVRELLHLDGALAAELERRSGGHPGFVVEWVGQRIERGELVAGPQGFRTAPGCAPDVPVDLGAVWTRRARALATDERTRRALELAAALGPVVDAAGWRRAVGDGAAAIESRLLAHDVIRPVEGGWRVVHGPLVEAIAAEAINGGRWAAINREAAAHADAADPALRARLYRLGERPAEAIGPLVDAAERALDDGRHAAALAWLDERAALIEAHLGGVDPAPGWPARLRLALLRKLYRVDDACALAEALWADPPDDPAAQYEILTEWAGALRRSGRVKEAVERRRLAFDAAQRSGDAGLVARGAAHLVRLLTLAGRLDEAKRYLDVATETQCEGYARVTLQFAAGLYWHHRGAYAAADEALSEARAYMLATGDLHGVSDADNTLAEVAHAQGDLDEADRRYASSTRYARLSGTSYAVPQLNQAILALDRGQPREARRLGRLATAALLREGNQMCLNAAVAARLVAAGRLGDRAEWGAALAVEVDLAGVPWPEMAGLLDRAIEAGRGAGFDVAAAVEARGRLR